MSLRATLIYASQTISFCAISQVQDQQSSSTPWPPLLSVLPVFIPEFSARGQILPPSLKKLYWSENAQRSAQTNCSYIRLPHSLHVTKIFTLSFSCIKPHNRTEGCIHFLARDSISFDFVFCKINNFYLSSPSGMKMWSQTLQLKEITQSPCRFFLV